MEQYIKKSALVAEIEKAIDEPAPSHDQQCPWEDGYYCGLNKAENIIDTLEVVKEVDLEKAIDGLTAGWIEGEEYGELQNINTCRCVTLGEVKEAMRCMFELGIKAAQKGE